ncbi:Hypothetical predicted protein [Olea europaea subsp. europaea]|uniref:DUF4228 domain protein n=1 Tax=Olea europaea subsp. europaea TaxID=158383 RepID=A0A8S0UVN7_OLEEU|nr:Hypothetical predicted protein [Olea europaea subsp. europaea]
MGIKILIPRCFSLKGNRIQSHHHGEGIIKLINYDGTVKIYNRPLHVSEIMGEFPKYMVCPSDSFYIGQKIPSLSEEDKLQLGQNYLLLPKHFFHSVFSFTFLLQCRSGCALLANKTASCQPFDIQKMPSGSLRIRVSEEFITQLIEQGKIKENDDDRPSLGKSIRVCNTPQLQKDYKQLVGRRQWKPKLDTIAERHGHKRKISIKRKKGPKKQGDRSKDLIFRRH